MSVAAASYTGPLPHPEVLARFEEIYPGAAKIIFETFDAQSKHRMKLEERVVLGNVATQSRGQVFGFILAGMVIVGGLLAAVLKSDLRGYALVVVAGATLIGIAIWQRFRQEKERDKKVAALEASPPPDPEPPLIEASAKH
jgi:uncharacterized membrane protein